MKLRKADYGFANQVVKLWLELYPDEKRVDLAHRLVQNTNAPVLVIQRLLLDAGGPDAELQKSYDSVAKWYGDECL